jgi:ATP-dependent Clp protease ATP-binding subunit ClpA
MLGAHSHDPRITVTTHVRSFTIALPLLAEADAEARSLGHSYIGPEHLLLAVAGNSRGASRAFFGRHGLTREALRESVASMIGPERVAARENGPLALAHRSMLALAHALSAGHEARRWPEPYSPDELLVALLADDVAPTAIVGAVFADAGLTLGAARDELVRLQAHGTTS